MHPARVMLDGEYYPSVEHAYQAAKTQNKEERNLIRLNSDPVNAKKMGYRVTQRPDWEEVRLSIMKDLLRQKFSDPPLAQKLLQTKPLDIVEGNTWHDNFWGSCTCPKCQDRGKNHLGNLLMEIRDSMCELWTARYNYSGTDRYDVTVKTGDVVFAPAWHLVKLYKDEQITWRQYTQLYVQQMRKSYQANKAHWISLLQKPSFTLVCFCVDPTHCHRTLLAQILVKVGRANNTVVIYNGERPQ